MIAAFAAAHRDRAPFHAAFAVKPHRPDHCTGRGRRRDRPMTGMLARLIASVRRPNSSAARPAIEAACSPSPVDPASARRGVEGALAAALSHRAGGRYASALAAIRDAEAASRDDARLAFAAGATYLDWGRPREARVELARAVALGLSDAEVFRQLGWAQLRAGAPEEAAASMRRAAELAPESASAWFGLASADEAAGRDEAAARNFERALEADPANADAALSRGSLELARGDAPGAERWFRRALELAPASPRAHLCVGVALAYRDRLEEALAFFRDALAREERDGGDADAFLLCAACLADLGRTEEAIEVYERHLPDRPNPEAHLQYAQALLAVGRFREGWSQYEFRWLRDSLLAQRPATGTPAWTGQDLRGKSILVFPEQGAGDLFQFLRYTPYLKALGANVLLSCGAGLDPIVETFPGIDRVLRPGEPPPRVDFFAHLLGLPRVFDTDAAKVPAKGPYLSADPERAKAWAKRLAGHPGLKVGLVWAGNPRHPRDRYRSIPLAALLPALRVPGVSWFSLQKGPAAEAVRLLAPETRPTDLAPELGDFRDTAAAIVGALDVVVTVDTSVAHLAGALGKDVWVLLALPADWRWLQDRTDSPWYPTARLFRQRERGDWTTVADALVAALGERVAGAGTVARPAATSRGVPAPATAPAPRLSRSLPGLSAVAETRAGIVQFFPDDEPAGGSIEWYGEWLRAELEIAERWASPGATVVEVGAGVGMHTLALSARLGPAGHLLAYEARPTVRRVLGQNLLANRAGNVTVMQRLAGGPGAGAGADGPPRFETVDDLLLEELALLKISAEADAAAILAGADATLWRLRPRILAGVPDEAALGRVVEAATAHGYRSWRIATPLFDPRNFNRRDADIFDGRSALAVAAVPEETEADPGLADRLEIGPGRAP